MMEDLAVRIAARLVARGETVVVAESSTGGLVSAALLAVPGASAYFLGGAVVYTATAREALLGIEAAEMAGLRSATPEYAALLARAMLGRIPASWALAETGAAGPSGNRYGDAAGHTCLTVAGQAEASRTLATGSVDRAANMRGFAEALLQLFIDTLEARAP